MKKAQAAGFTVSVVYVAVESVEVSIERVKQRVRKGGHDIPEDVQRRRFDKSIENAAIAGLAADAMMVFQNATGKGHQLMAVVEQGRVTTLETERPAWVDRALQGIPHGEAVRQSARTAQAPKQHRPTPTRRRDDDDRGR